MLHRAVHSTGGPIRLRKAVVRLAKPRPNTARRQLSGLSQADVLAKTQSTTATGRANDQYDPQLARTAKLANTRKFGDDQSHDAFSQGRAQQNGQDSQRTDVLKRFRQDPAMNNHTLGNATAQGVEVLNKGKVIGYYR